jgi:hypothetical protein
MSDVPPTAEEPTAEEPTAEEPTAEEQGPCTAPHPAKETSPLRLIVLLSVFGVALVGLLYDYTIARPAIKKADNTIQGLLEGSIKDPSGDGAVTEDEVQSLLGSKPSRVTQLETGKIEVYSWRSGLPYRTYDLYVVYSGRRLPLLYSATANAEPTGTQLPEKMIVPNNLTDEEIKSLVRPKLSVADGPSTGSGGKTDDAGRGPKAPAGVKVTPDNGAGGGDQGTQPPTEEPKIEESTPTMEPAKEEPAKEEPAKEEPAKEEPAKEQPPAGDQPVKEEPAKTPAGGGQV